MLTMSCLTGALPREQTTTKNGRQQSYSPFTVDPRDTGAASTRLQITKIISLIKRHYSDRG